MLQSFFEEENLLIFRVVIIKSEATDEQCSLCSDELKTCNHVY